VRPRSSRPGRGLERPPSPVSGSIGLFSSWCGAASRSCGPMVGLGEQDSVPWGGSAWGSSCKRGRVVRGRRTRRQWRDARTHPPVALSSRRPLTLPLHLCRHGVLHGRKYAAFGVSDASRPLVSHTADVCVGAASLRREAVKSRRVERGGLRPAQTAPGRCRSARRPKSWRTGGALVSDEHLRAVWNERRLPRTAAPLARRPIAD
jgi:hypothetical protein